MSARLAEYLQRLERLGEVLEPEAVSILAVAFADADLTTYVAAQLAAAADSESERHFYAQWARLADGWDEGVRWFDDAERRRLALTPRLRVVLAELELAAIERAGVGWESTALKSIAESAESDLAEACAELRGWRAARKRVGRSVATRARRRVALQCRVGEEMVGVPAAERHRLRVLHRARRACSSARGRRGHDMREKRGPAAALAARRAPPARALTTTQAQENHPATGGGRRRAAPTPTCGSGTRGRSRTTAR